MIIKKTSTFIRAALLEAGPLFSLKKSTVYDFDFISLTQKLTSVLILCLFMNMTLSEVVNAANAEADSIQNSEMLAQSILSSFQRGQDVQALMRQYQAQQTEKAKASPPLKARQAQYVQQSLVRFIQLVEQTKEPIKTTHITRLINAWQQFQADELLYLERFKDTELQLKDRGVEAVFYTRLNQARADYYQHTKGLNDAFKLIFSNYLAMSSEGQKTIREQVAYQQQLAQIIRLYQQAQKVNGAAKASNKTLITLGQQVLPYQAEQSLIRAPQYTPELTPVYQLDVRPAPTLKEFQASDTVGLTQEIINQAKVLDYDYVKIYQFVQNQIHTQWYHGSIKGAHITLRQKQGNPIDQAALLSALLRASGVATRFVQGVIEQDIQVLKDNLNLSSTSAVLNYLKSSGVAYKTLIRGGQVAALEMEHTWLAAYVPYRHYRGTTVNREGAIWIPLAPAFKTYQYPEKADLLQQANIDVNEWYQSHQQQYRPNQQSLMADIKDRLQNYLTTEGQGELDDWWPSAAIITQQTGLLPNTLPFTVKVVTFEGPELNKRAQQRLKIIIRKQNDPSSEPILEHTIATHQLINERLTLSYLPATVSDQNLVNQFGGLDAVPAYLIQLRVQLKINGRLIKTGAGMVDLGNMHRIELTLLDAEREASLAQTLLAGSYHVLSLNHGQALPRSTQEQRLFEAEPSNDIKQSGDNTAETEFEAAALLNRVALTYNQRWRQSEQELSDLLNVLVAEPSPSIHIVNNALRVDAVLGQAQQLVWQGVTLDAAYKRVTPIARKLDSEQAHQVEKQWLQLAAFEGSQYESTVFTELFNEPAISADKGLIQAYEQGQILYELTADNFAGLKASLNHPEAVITIVANWLQQDYHVTIPGEQSQLDDWQGSVWKVVDPLTGSIGYFIRGELAGGSTVRKQWQNNFIMNALQNAYSVPAGLNYLDGIRVLKLRGSDGQRGVVNTTLPYGIGVKVKDLSGRPIKQVPVWFTSEVDVKLSDLSSNRTSTSGRIKVFTNALGIAQVSVKLPKSTQTQPVYLKKKNTDEHPSRARYVLVDAKIDFNLGKTQGISYPFVLLAFPDKADKAEVIHSKTLDYHLPQRAPASPNHWTDTVITQVIDRFANPVANETVRYQVEAAKLNEMSVCKELSDASKLINATLFQFEQCPDSSRRILGQCGGHRTQTLKTNSSGVASIGVIMGNMIAYHYRVSMSALSETKDLLYQTRECFVFSGITVSMSSETPLNADGGILRAARLGEPVDEPIKVRFFINEAHGNDGLYETTEETTPVNLSAEIKTLGISGNGGLIRGPFGKKPSVFYLTADSNEPNFHEILIKAKFPEILDTDGVLIDPPLEIESIIGSYYSLDVGIKEQIPGHGKSRFSFDPNYVPDNDNPFGFKLIENPQGDSQAFQLDGNGKTSFNTQLTFEFQSGLYGPLSSQVLILENGIEVQAYSPTGEQNIKPEQCSSPIETQSRLCKRQGLFTIPRGTVFDIEKHYTAKLVLNRGSKYEIESEPYDIDIQQVIFTRLDRQITVSRQVDFNNAKSCEMQSNFDFEISQAAKITLTFKPLDDQGNEKSDAYWFTLLNNTHYEKGSHQLSISPDDVPDGQYNLAIKAESELVTYEESYEGKATSRQTVTDHMPLGHAVVKGIDLFSGGLNFSASDVTLSTRGTGLNFTRSYNSGHNSLPGVMGVGWSHNYNARISENECGEVIVSSGDGSGGTFFLNERVATSDYPTLAAPGDNLSILKSGKGYHSILIKNETQNSYDFFARNGNRYHFEYTEIGKQKFWRLEYIQDTNDNRIRLAYSPSREQLLLNNVIADDGRELIFDYEVKQFAYHEKTVSVLKTLTSVDGVQINFDYDTLGNLIAATREEDEHGNALKSEYYTYEQGGDRFSHYLLKSYQDPEGHITQYHSSRENYAFTNGQNNPVLGFLYQYDEIKEPTGSGEHALTHILRDKQWLSTQNTPTTEVTVSDPLNNKTTYTLNRYGAPQKVTIAQAASGIADATGTATLSTWKNNDILMASRQDANGHLTQWDYDTYGNITREMLTGQGNGPVFTLNNTWYPPTDFEHPISNRIKTRTDRNGHMTSYAYDTKGNLLSVTDGKGQTIHHTYDNNGDRRQTRDRRSNITRFNYTAQGYLSEQISAQGHREQLSWNERGLKTSRIDPRGHKTQYRYDRLDRLTQLNNPLGQKTHFSYDKNGLKLSETDAREFKTQWTYDDAGRVIRIQDPDDHIKTLAYDHSGNKIKESDYNNDPGIVWIYQYDAANRLVKQTDPLGNHFIYQYDGLANKTRSQIQGSSDNFANRESRYEYDPLGRQISQILVSGKDHVYQTYYDGENKTKTIDPLLRETHYQYDDLNQLLKKTQPLGRISEYEYDKNGNVIKTIAWVTDDESDQQIRHNHYDQDNRLIIKTDALGYESRLLYDPSNNLIQSTDSRNHSSFFDYDALNRLIKKTDPVNSVTEYDYDAVGSRIRETQANGNTIHSEYDALNRLTHQYDAVSDLLSNRQYDANSNLRFSTDGRGQRSEFRYNVLNQRIESRLPENRNSHSEYDVLDNVISYMDALGNTQKYQYNALNQLIKVTDPAPFNYSETTVYDDVGNQTQVTNRRGHHTDYQYDALNQLEKVTTSAPFNYEQRYSYDRIGNQRSETDPRDQITLYNYDKENRLLSTEKDGITLLRNEYDPVGNLKSSQDANHNDTVYSYDPANQLLLKQGEVNVNEHYSYDPMGNPISHQDGEERITLSHYDQRSRLDSSTRNEDEVTRFEYDDNNNRRAVILPEGQRTEYHYDGADRLIQIDDALQTAGSPEGRSSLYEYDANDNQTATVDANGERWSFEFDALNRQTDYTYPGGLLKSLSVFDENSNVIQRTAPSGKVDTHDYDELDRLKLSHYPLPADPTGDDLQQIATDYDANSNPTAMHETYSGVSGTRTTLKRYDHFDRLEQVINSHGKTIAYRYDLNGNRLSMTDPDGKQTRYEYDKRNRISYITTQNQGSTSYEYDRSDRVKTIDYPNHSQVSNIYDAAGRLKARSNRLNSVIVSEFLYGYDKNGNRIKQTEHRASLDEDTRYEYDPLERLETVIYPDKTTTYAYDGNYNRTSEQTKNTNDIIIIDKTYSNDNRNKLTGIIDNLDNSQNISYTHDPNGNQTSKTKAGETTFYRYDVRNQLSQVKDGLVTLGRYGYDYQGLRISKEDDNSEVLLYSYDDQSVLLQSDENGITQNRYTYGGYHLIALTDKNQISQFYLHDGLGSVVDLLGYDSQIKASYQYDAFGNYRTKTETDTVNDFGFTGHEMDDETSLVYMKARFYDPDSGRFLTEDTYLGMQNTPPSLNRYLYAYGNPTRYFDPDGHKLQDFQDMGTQAYSEGNYIEAGVIAVAQAFYETADGILGGTVEDASIALQKQQSLSDASREFASKQVEKASEVIEEYAEETAAGIIVGAGTAYACSKARAACNAIEDNAGKLYDKANKAFGDKKSKSDSSAKVTEEGKRSPDRTSDKNVKAETQDDVSIADDAPLKEGDVLTGKEYKDRREKGSSLRGHHVPQQERLKQQNINPKDGTVVVIENQAVDNAGNKIGHTGTRTYGRRGSKTAKEEKDLPLSESEQKDLDDLPVSRLGKETKEKIKQKNRENFPEHYKDNG